jgi:hypothetical protein
LGHFGDDASLAVRLATSEKGTLLAASSGKLTMHPPSGDLRGEPTVEPLVPGEPLPKAVDVYLHVSPMSLWGLLFTPEVAATVVGFLYRNVETASIGELLADKLEQSAFPPERSTLDRQLRRFVGGQVGLAVSGGQAIGRAALVATGQREAAFGVVTAEGAVDPHIVYDQKRELVEEGLAAVDELLGLVGAAQFPILVDELSTADVLQLARLRLYPRTTLEALRKKHDMSRADFRQLGDAQKALYRSQLLARTGHAPAGSQALAFEFADHDAQNLFQLEALVEFYRNFQDPWKRGAAPRSEGDSDYQRVDWLEPTGERARLSSGNSVVLDSDFAFLDELGGSWLRGGTATVAGNRATLSSVAVKHLELISDDDDFLFLAEDTAPDRGGVYRIVGRAGLELRLDGEPQVPGNQSAWQIHLGDVFQCLSLALDKHPKTFHRIVAFDRVGTTIVLDRPVEIDGETSAWRLHRSPIVVVVDSFGGGRLVSDSAVKSFRLEGAAARSIGGDDRQIELSDAVHLRWVNKQFDTIHLAAATTPSRTFRIVDVDLGARTVTVDRPTGIGGETTRWTIPAGVGGRIEQSNHLLLPAVSDPTERYDAYDGAVFLVRSIRDGGSSGPLVVGPFPLTSYSSRAAPSDELSSARGNRMYTLRSQPSVQGGDVTFKNFALSLSEPNLRGHINEARDYFTPSVDSDRHVSVPPDPDGKNSVLLHQGNQGLETTRRPNGSLPPRGTGSHGCFVHFSGFLALRTALADAVLAFREDNAVRKVRERTTRLASQALFADVKQLPLHQLWRDKVRGTLWLIRPDELPLSEES